MKKAIVILVLWLGYALPIQHIKAQASLRDKLQLKLAALPDFDGNVTLDNNIVYKYTPALLAGVGFYQTQRSEVEEAGQLRSIAVIDEDVITLTPIGLHLDLVRSGSFAWSMRPSVAYQRLTQERKLNLVDRDNNAYKTENSNLISDQLSGALVMKFQLGRSVRLDLLGSASPLNSVEEVGNGYDTSLIAKVDGEGNYVYLGGSGDFAYRSSTSLLYYDAGVDLTIANLFYSGDIIIGFKKTSIQYDYVSVRREVFAGDIKSDDEAFIQSRNDLQFTLGMELSFLTQGSLQPFFLLSFTDSTYQDVNGDDVHDRIFGFGLEIRKL